MPLPTTKIDPRSSAQIDVQIGALAGTGSSRSAVQFDAQCEEQRGRLDPTAWEIDVPPFACSDFGQVKP